MSVGVETPFRILVGTGVATDFDYEPTFTLSDPDHLSVFLDNVETTDFTHTEGGIRFSQPIGLNVQVKLLRITPVDQPTPSAGLRTFDLQVVEKSLDRTTRQTQEAVDAISRTPKAEPGDTPPGGSFKQAPSTTQGQDQDGNIIARTPAEELSHLGVTAIFQAASTASEVATAAAASTSENASTAATSAATAATSANTANTAAAAAAAAAQQTSLERQAAAAAAATAGEEARQILTLLTSGTMAVQAIDEPGQPLYQIFLTNVGNAKRLDWSPATVSNPIPSLVYAVDEDQPYELILSGTGANKNLSWRNYTQ